MKKWMIGLMCLLLLLPAAGLASGGIWDQTEWETIAAALASDEDNPVPPSLRLTDYEGQPILPKEKNEKGYLNILLLSSSAQNMSDNFAHTDVMLICRVDLNSGVIRLLSLPEQAMVCLPGLPEPIALRYVNCFGGPQLAVRAVNEALGTNLNRYYAVNMNAFTQIVDTLGGVTLDLSEEDAQALELSAGRQKLSGGAALRFARLRRPGDGSWRVRTLLNAILRQTVSGISLSQALSLLDIFLPAVDTSMTTDDLLELILSQFMGKPEENILTQSLDAGEDGTLNDESLKAAHAFLY